MAEAVVGATLQLLDVAPLLDALSLHCKFTMINPIWAIEVEVCVPKRPAIWLACENLRVIVESPDPAATPAAMDDPVVVTKLIYVTPDEP